MKWKIDTTPVKDTNLWHARLAATADPGEKFHEFTIIESGPTERSALKKLIISLCDHFTEPQW